MFDLSRKADVLKWTGVARSVAKWKPRTLAVMDGYLYVLKNEKDKTYEEVYSLYNKMVSPVPAETIGGFEQVGSFLSPLLLLRFCLNQLSVQCC